jgi:hypothetical protein
MRKQGIPIRRMNGKRLEVSEKMRPITSTNSPAVAKWWDKRDLGEVFYHELPGHEPLPTQ